MSKIGQWIIEKDAQREYHETFSHDPEKEELNDTYFEYALFGHRNKLGSLNDLVCSYEGEQRDPRSYLTRHFEEIFGESP